MATAVQEQGGEVVYTFQKNTREEVRAALTEYQGKPLVDIRVFVPDTQGGFVATRKGLCVGRDLLPQLEEAVRALRAADAGR